MLSALRVQLQGLLQCVRAGLQQPSSEDQVQQFVHPGTLIDGDELQLLAARARCPEQAPCFAQALASLMHDTPLTIETHALKDVSVGWKIYNELQIGHDELVEWDGTMAVRQTMAWLVTNDERHALNAAAIIRAWATQNKTFTGRNAPLEAAWGVTCLARAAELLKHTWPGWDGSGVEEPFRTWVAALIMPQLNNEILEPPRLPLANWQAAVAECKGQLALLLNDARLWDEALTLWLRVADAYLKPSGECGETSRDLYHSQFGLGGLIQLAELAWHQGVDLFSHNDRRLLTAMEFHAFINLGGRPPECTYELKGIGFLPCGWEVGFNHYAGREGLAMPQTQALLEAHRPEKQVFCWGLGTLTHQGAAAACRAMPAAATAAPAVT